MMDESDPNDIQVVKDNSSSTNDQFPINIVTPKESIEEINASSLQARAQGHIDPESQRPNYKNNGPSALHIGMDANDNDNANANDNDMNDPSSTIEPKIQQLQHVLSNTNANENDNENGADNLVETLTVPLVITSPSKDSEFRNRQRTSSDISSTSNANLNINVNANLDDIKPPLSPTTYIYNRRKERLQECFHRAVEIQRNVWRNTITLMNFLAKVLFWASLIAMSAGIVYYTKELAMHGKEPHLIAWFSAGGFVILGFPISIYGILMHLTNYYQPNVQCYVVRILWMVPIYSIESWLCLRFHKVAIYIETLRDCYESFVLYCFFQYLIEVLGGEESLVMLLKDKSPTRGVHMWSMDWCIKPWVMGQPISTVDTKTGQRSVKWTSPFFKNCKLGCLQYVLLKFISSIFVVVLEKFDFYKEGDFSPTSGYLYICILTNTSQCWALYCLIFFYYATKNELGPIRPVGKFLSVKALVFFTWWQSVGIAFLHQMDLIPAYVDGDWTADEVAKGLQAYLICIEMFIASIVHTFVFPHTDYTRPLSTVKTPTGVHNFGRRIRVGRRFGRRNYNGLPYDDRSHGSKTSDAPTNSNVHYDDEIPNGHGHGHQTLEMTLPRMEENSTLQSRQNTNTNSEKSADRNDALNSQSKQKRTGFVNALIDSSVPRDVMDNTVGIARGDFTVEKKTLLYHAAASDEYSLFAKRRKAHGKSTRNTKSK